MSTENDKQLVHDIFAAISSGDEARYAELIHPDYVDHGPDGEYHGVEGFREVIGIWRTGFPDLQVRAVDVIVEGDIAAWRVEGTGTHTGELMGIPPTGRRVTFRGIDMGRRRDGKALEHWSAPDVFGMLQQLGVVPEPAAAAR